MKKLVYIIALSCIGQSAFADCYADYKAKKDDPLKLHYGVIELPANACRSRQAAAQAVAPRLADQGWTLLNIVGIFDASGLAEREPSAGQYFLRY